MKVRLQCLNFINIWLYGGGSQAKVFLADMAFAPRRALFVIVDRLDSDSGAFMANGRLFTIAYPISRSYSP